MHHIAPLDGHNGFTATMLAFCPIRHRLSTGIGNAPRYTALRPQCSLFADAGAVMTAGLYSLSYVTMKPALME